MVCIAGGRAAAREIPFGLPFVLADRSRRSSGARPCTPGQFTGDLLKPIQEALARFALTSPDLLYVRAMNNRNPIPCELQGLGVPLDGEISPPRFVVAPFFPRSELTEIVGAHGSLKSTIALDACLSVATGRPWGGVPVEQGRAAFITLEDSRFTLARRIKAWLDGVHRNADVGRAAEEESAAECAVRANMTFLAREDAQGIVLTATEGAVTRACLKVADRVAALVDGHSLVVLETVSRIHDGPETNEGFRALVEALERVAVVTGTALAVVRHTSKKAAREMTVDSHTGRGGSALSDAVRSSLTVARNRDKPLAPVRLTATKATHAQEGAVLSWRPVVVPELECVRLEAISPEGSARDDAERLLAYLAPFDSGITRTDLHNAKLQDLPRPRREAALEHLLATGRVREQQERRGKTKQHATVYYVAGVGDERRAA